MIPKPSAFVLFSLSLSFAGSGCSGLAARLRDFGPLGDGSCDAYTERARGYSYGLQHRDWEPFVPMFESPVDAAADLAFCRDIAKRYDVPIIYEERKGGQAIYFVIKLEKDFEKWNDVERQAMLFCHEVHHIIREHWLGPQRSSLVYLDESGNLSFEGDAFAITFGLGRRYGWSESRINSSKKNRWERFPKRYVMEHAVDSACVARHMEWADQAFIEWAKTRITFPVQVDSSEPTAPRPDAP
jgi:hypothetical protein